VAVTRRFFSAPTSFFLNSEEGSEVARGGARPGAGRPSKASRNQVRKIQPAKIKPAPALERSDIVTASEELLWRLLDELNAVNEHETAIGALIVAGEDAARAHAMLRAIGLPSRALVLQRLVSCLARILGILEFADRVWLSALIEPKWRAWQRRLELRDAAIRAYAAELGHFASGRRQAKALAKDFGDYAVRGAWRFDRSLPNPKDPRHAFQHRALTLGQGQVPGWRQMIRVLAGLRSNRPLSTIKRRNRAPPLVATISKQAPRFQ
jgi:hypothetical protein